MAVAFATVYFSFVSLIISKVGILNDLYTLLCQRGKGIGRKFIEYCKDYALKNEAVRLQWAISLDNILAKKLYDSMETKKSTWDFYVYKK